MAQNYKVGIQGYGGTLCSSTGHWKARSARSPCRSRDFQLHCWRRFRYPLLLLPLFGIVLIRLLKDYSFCMFHVSCFRSCRRIEPDFWHCKREINSANQKVDRLPLFLLLFARVFFSFIMFQILIIRQLLWAKCKLFQGTSHSSLIKNSLLYCHTGKFALLRRRCDLEQQEFLNRPLRYLATRFQNLKFSDFLPLTNKKQLSPTEVALRIQGYIFRLN